MSTGGSSKSSWQSQLISPGQRLASLMLSNRLADITITFPGHHQHFQAHRLILAMTSPVFEAMLFGPLAEEGPEVALKGDPPEAFHWLLEYMYKGHTNLPNVARCVQIYQLASKYQIEALMTLCSEYLCTELSATNLPEMYDTAVLLEDSNLLQRCAQVVSHSPRAVLTSPHLGRLTRHALTHLLSQPLHIASEVTLFRAILNWGQAHGSCVEEVRVIILEFLSLVRFLAMTTDEFVEYVMPSGVLTLEEISAILMNIKNISDVPLPLICCKVRDRRLNYEEELQRKIVLATTHNFPKTKKNTRGSIFVHSSQEQLLVTDLKTAGTIQLGKIECKVLNPTSGSAIVSIKDSQGNLVGSTTTESHLADFGEPVSLGGDVYSVTVAMEGHWPRGDLGEFLATQDEVRLNGRLAYTEGRSGALSLYFWSFN